MSWPLRALIGPFVWAIAFSVIYAAHGIGCAWEWPARPTLLGDLHQLTLVSLWVVAVGIAGAVLLTSKGEDKTAATVIRAGDWIGLLATILTLFPVLGLTSCNLGP